MNKYAFTLPVFIISLVILAFIIVVKPLVGVALIPASFLLNGGFLYWAACTEYIAHTNRIEIRTLTPFYIHTKTVWLAKVVEVNVERTPIDMVFGTKSYTIQTTSGQAISMPYVKQDVTF